MKNPAIQAQLFSAPLPTVPQSRSKSKIKKKKCRFKKDKQPELEKCRDLEGLYSEGTGQWSKSSEKFKSRVLLNYELTLVSKPNSDR